MRCAMRSAATIRPHHQQLAIHIEHAVFGEDVEQRVLGEKCLGKTGQLR
jgi:hypothetical protein